jgi:hypothetical protein
MKLSIVSLTPLSAVELDLMMSGTTISSFCYLGTRRTVSGVRMKKEYREFI